MTRRLAFTAGVLVTGLITAAGLIVLAVFALADRELDLDDPEDRGGLADGQTTMRLDRASIDYWPSETVEGRRVMRPILRRRRPEPDPTPAPDWAALHLDQFARFTICQEHTSPGVTARNDQAEAEFAGWLTDMGVDLDDPVALHAVLAGLTVGARWAFRMPLWAGPQLGYHVNVLARRVPTEVGR